VQRVLTGLQFLQNSKDRASGGFLPLLASETESGARNNMPVTEAQLITDGMGSILAGTDTTGFTLAVATWAIFSDEAVYSRHHTELRTIWPDMAAHPEVQDLEKLSYLRACVKVL
jgi:cytochrome P450